MIGIKIKNLETLGEDVKSKLGKKVKSYKKWKIYKGTNSSGNETYRCFTPDEYPEVDYEDCETDTLEQAIDWIDNSDLTENIEFNKDDIEENLIPIDKVTEDFKSDVCNPRFIYNLLDDICEISNSYDDFDLDTDCENILSVIDNIEDKLYELKSIIELCQK